MHKKTLIKGSYRIGHHGHFRASLAQTGRWMLSRGQVPDAARMDLAEDFTPAEMEHWSPMPVVPCAHARTARGVDVVAVGATTVAETATGWSSAVRDQWRTCHAAAPSMATVTGRDRMMSPGAPAGVSPGSKNGSPV